MRNGWRKSTLGEIAEYINGYPFKPSELGESGTPVIRIKQLLNPSEEPDRSEVSVPEKCVLHDGDIVFSWSGTLAVRIWNRGPAFLNQHLFRVVERKGIVHEWLPLAIEHAIDDLSEKTHGTTMKHITKQTLLPHECLVPPMEEQRRIVDLVASVDAYIAGLEKLAKAARTARNSLLDEMLCSGRQTWTDTTPNIKRFGDLAVLQRGHDLPVQSRLGGDVPVVASNGPVGFHNQAIGPVPGVITGRSGTIGRVTYTEEGYWPLNTTLYVTDFRGNNEKFVALSLESMKLETFAGGSTVPSLDRKVFRNELVFVPSLSEQIRIVEIVQSMDDAVAVTERVLGHAKQLRAGLLSDLLSGEYEIPESYDKFLGAA